MIFLTYNDVYSGIYKSQVTDVCNFFEGTLGTEIRLVALVSIRNYRSQKKLIRERLPNAKVLPMFPKVENWDKNALILKLFGGIKKGEAIWARGPFACNLAISLKQSGHAGKVIFDARGAYEPEFNEYDVSGNKQLRTEIASIEENALRKSDKQLAVSSKLASWWQQKYHFSPPLHEIIPCTLSSDFEKKFPSEDELRNLRTKLGFTPNDVVLVYSGSSAGWQSFNLVDDYLFQKMTQDPNIKLIFLSPHKPDNSKIFRDFSDRILTQWVKPAEVRNMLLACDHGLLIREDSVTNQVASPVKFAEYLSCGLQVIISPNIGDFSEFVKQQHCGNISSDKTFLKQVPYDKKVSTHQLALNHFSKGSEQIRKKYSSLLAG